MAYIATIKILVDEANEAIVYDGLNEMLRTAQEPVDEDDAGTPWLLDWKFESVAHVSESLNEAIAKGDYSEGDAFNDWVIFSRSDHVKSASTEPFKLVVEAYATDEFGEGPSWAEVTVAPEFLQTLERLRRVCQDENLESVTVKQGPARWDQEDDLRIRGDSLRVWHDDFWFEAHPKHGDYSVETRSILIDHLIQVARKIANDDAENPLPLPDGFDIQKGIVFYAYDPGNLADSYFEKAEEEKAVD